MTERPLRRVLIVKMWALGDLLMATPMIAALRARWPGVQIAWAVESVHADLLAGHPGIDELIPVDSGAWRRMLKKGKIVAWLARSLGWHSQMRRRRFDAVINCQADKWWSAFLCAGPRRIGLYPQENLPASRRFYTCALNRPKDPPLHNTDHYLTATRALGCPDADKAMTIGESPEEAVFLAEFFQAQGLSEQKPIVILAPFSNGANRCWEPECYAQVADWLATTHGAQLVMTIGPDDEEKAREIIDMVAVPIVLATGTTIRQYVALLRRADLVISGDSSPMHIAAAVGTPFVTVFGPTPTFERVPLVGKGIALAKPLPCAPCDRPSCANPVFRECMKLVTVADVQAAVAQFLS